MRKAHIAHIGVILAGLALAGPALAEEKSICESTAKHMSKFIKEFPGGTNYKIGLGRTDQEYLHCMEKQIPIATEFQYIFDPKPVTEGGNRFYIRKVNEAPEKT